MPHEHSSKDVVLEFYGLALEKFDPKAAFKKYATPDFIEHSADIAGGTRQEAIAFLEGLIQKFPAPKWQIVRGSLFFSTFTSLPLRASVALQSSRSFECKTARSWSTGTLFSPFPKTL